MTELQENVIKVLEYKYGWSGIKRDSQMMQELFRDIVNATADVINKSSDISDIISESGDFKQIKSFTKELKPVLENIVKNHEKRTAVCPDCGSDWLEELDDNLTTCNECGYSIRTD